MVKNIKIFMCTHRKISVIPPLTIPTQGGAAIHAPITDARPDVGEFGSISELNPDYCELTVQYYAWKNEEADYYGLCHYRRFFSFDERNDSPYSVFGHPSKRVLRRIIFPEDTMRNIIEKYDLIVPRSEDMGCNVYSQYASVHGCTEKDLRLFESIICKRHPELSSFTKKYLAGNRQYFCNMFIMKREIFFDYCEKLFGILSEFDTVAKPDGALRCDRVNGYLAERFLGIYITSLFTSGAKIKELCRIDIDCSFKKRILTKIFPPESKIRFIAKKIFKTKG